MSDRRVQTGKILTLVAAAAVTSGDVIVLNDIVGIAQTTAAIGETYTVMIAEVHRMPKVAGASTAIAVGQKVDWDADPGGVAVGITAATGDVTDFGVCTQAATDADTEVEVLLTPGTGTAG